MMRRCLLAAASQAWQASSVPQGFQQALGPTHSRAASFASAALAAWGGGKHAAAPLSGCAAAAAAVASRQHQLSRLPSRLMQQQHARGYAQMGTKPPRTGYKPPVEMQKAMQMRLSMVSPNVLAEPYRGVPPKLPLSAYFSISGWKEVGRRFLNQLKSLYTLSKCQKNIPGFERPAFKSASLQLYKDVCALLAEGDKTSLRQLVTPAVFSDMKRQLKQREDGGWARVQWDIVREPTMDEISTVHGRMILIDPKDDSHGFVQLTVRIPSQQRFAAYNRSGKLVAGSPEQAIEVEDYWVLEHAFDKKKKSGANRWRLAGRLSILPNAVEQQQQQEQQPAVGAAGAAVGAAGAAAPAASQQLRQQPPKQQPREQQSEPEVRIGHIADQQRQKGHQQWTRKPAAAAKQAAAVGGGRGRR